MGVTLIASVVGAVPALVAVKEGKLVTPFCPVPAPVTLLVVRVQLKVNTPPATLLVVVSVIADCVPALHDVLAVAVGALTSGVGITVAVSVKVLPVQPAVDIGVTV
jgi:hypothetical protein